MWQQRKRINTPEVRIYKQSKVDNIAEEIIACERRWRNQANRTDEDWVLKTEQNCERTG
jgi:hypothetical protein